jgi:tRNA pseudouridine13 synthase
MNPITEPTSTAAAWQHALQWPYLYGEPEASALLRVEDQDFIVEETLSFTPSGHGEHVFLFIEKQGQNTQYVARWLAEMAGVKNRVVSYAGLKDRHAITRQWFCLPWPIKQELPWQDWQHDGIRILHTVRNLRRLRLGAIAHNHFTIRLRQVSDPVALQNRLALVRKGVPNYYGEQRFGRQGGNLALADQLFSGHSITDRHIRGLALSAARSFLFNQQLAARVSAGQFLQLDVGDVVQLDGTGSVFVVHALDDALMARLQSGDIHPTAWLPGEGQPLVSAEVAVRQQQQLAPWQTWVDALIAMRMASERRFTRLIAKDMRLSWQGQDALIQFALPTGCFATSVLRELVHYRDVRRETAQLEF